MGYIVTIYEEGEDEARPFEITDAAEITPLFDIEADEAAFELGFEPSEALVYYLAFDWSPFDTILKLLDAQKSILFMISCIEHVWPLVEQHVPEAVEEAQQALELGLTLAIDPESVVHDDMFPAEQPHEWAMLEGTFDAVYQEEKGSLRNRRKPPVSARAQLARALIRLLGAIRSLYKTYYGAGLVTVAPGGVSIKRLHYGKDAYQVGRRCRKAIKAAGGDPEAEENWQVLEIFRIALGMEPERSFAYRITYEYERGDNEFEYYDVDVVGMIEPDEGGQIE
jgi:hypothetical protein